MWCQQQNNNKIEAVWLQRRQRNTEQATVPMPTKQTLMQGKKTTNKRMSKQEPAKLARNMAAIHGVRRRHVQRCEHSFIIVFIAHHNKVWGRLNRLRAGEWSFVGSEHPIAPWNDGKGHLARQFRLRQQVVTRKNMDQVVQHFLLLGCLCKQGRVLWG